MEASMTNFTSQSASSIRKLALPVLAIVASVVSPLAGAVLGAFALKQIANRQTEPKKKRFALAGIVLLAGFASVYTAVSFWLLSTGYDLYP
jgi:uncharacterized membrane protein